MATLTEIRQQYPQYSDLSNRQLLDGLHNKYYSDISKDDFYSKALGGTQLPKLDSDKDIANRTVKGALRSAASTLPLVGGFADDIEAGIRAIGDSTREEELSKIRQENKEYQQQLERAGVGGLNTGAEIVGSIGAGIGGLSALGKGIGKLAPSLGKAAQTTKGQVALGASIGAIEGAGFADEQAGTGAVIGGAVGGSVPVIGRVIAKALGKTDNIAGKSIDDIAGSNQDVKTILKGVNVSDDVAEEVAPLADRALQNTENRVQQTILKDLEVNNIEDIAAPAKAEYASFIDKFGGNVIPDEQTQKLFARRRVNKIAQDLIADNPEKYAGVNPSSISFLQDVKSRAAAQGRTGSENAPAFQDASRAIKETVDKNFSGFKELNTKFAKAIEAEDLVNRISNLNLQEDSNIAKSILKGQNKRDLAKSFGKERADKLAESLRNESARNTTLKRLRAKATNKLQGVRNFDALKDAPSRANPIELATSAVGKGVNFATGNRSKNKALELIKGGSRGKISPQLSAILSQQTSRQTGE